MTPFRILSYNVGQHLTSHAALTELILSSRADVVLLQEVTTAFINTCWDTLVQAYPHRTHGVYTPDGRTALVTLSTHCVLEIEDLLLNPASLVHQQRLVISLDGRLVTLYNIHTTFPWIRFRHFFGIPLPVYDSSVRSKEVTVLVQRIRREPYPIVIGGDFNLTPQSKDYRKLTAVLLDAFASFPKKHRATWPANRTPSLYIPSPRPIFQLDYLFHSSDFAALDVQILARSGSDHLPQIYELQLHPVA